MIPSVVLDNSALCRYRFREPDWENVKPLIQAVRERRVIAYAPQHLLLEFLHVAKKKANVAGLKDGGRAVKRHYDWLATLPIQYVQVDYSANVRELRLLVDRGAGSYDALYVHLARQLNAALCTCDKGIVALYATGLRFKAYDLDHSPFSLWRV